MITVLLIILGNVQGATIYVPDSYPTIQGAIDAASAGDTIIVEPGTYVENIDFLGKAVTLMSEQGADVTAIDGNHAGRVVTCQSGEGADSVLDGFTITNGYVKDDNGGGMYIWYSDPTVKNCTFSDNKAESPYDDSNGGGMYNESSNPTVTNCTFTYNSAGGGGGMCNMESSPTVIDCTFSYNGTGAHGLSGWGGGMLNCSNSSPTVTNSTFSYNGGTGGGMCNYESSNPTVTGCNFSNNHAPGGYQHAGYGGGMHNSYSNPTVTNCIFSKNSATSGYFYGGTGGGLSNSYSNPLVVNCLFSENKVSGGSGGGISGGGTMINCIFSGNTADYGGGIAGSATITNCSFSGNTANESGGGIKGSGPVTNCILWDNEPDQVHGNDAITYSCVQGGHPGTGNIDSDPLMKDPLNDDFHITHSSPCRDTGNNDAPSIPVTDFEGDPRVASECVDMGADEFNYYLDVPGTYSSIQAAINAASE
ncbi:MAG: right-handed parallel beta-helix repeat-containing protein, partial [Planctomycetota bacterium]